MNKLKLNIQRFASTNQTAHYNLSQYIATDKPTYLIDYNGDMLKIDTAIYTVESKALQNESNIGTMSSLSTTEKSSLVGALNEVNTQVGLNTDAIANLNTSVGANTGNIGTMANLNTTDKSNLVNAINEVVSDFNDLKANVLWTNSDPTQDFQAQTISLDLTNYDIIEVCSTTGNYRGVVDGESINMIHIQDSNGNYSGNWFIDTRTVNITTSGLVFSDNRGAKATDTNGYVVRNNINKPTKIIGYIH